MTKNIIVPSNTYIEEIEQVEKHGQQDSQHQRIVNFIILFFLLKSLLEVEGGLAVPLPVN